MPLGAAAIIGGGTLLSGILGSNAATSAAQTQANAANQAAQVSQNEFNTTQNNLRPFLQTGSAADTALMSLLGFNFQGPLGQPGAYPYSFSPGPLLTNPQTAMGPAPQYNLPTFNWQQSPGYAAALQGSTQALQNAGATTTGALSGNTLKAVSGAGSQFANQDYQQNYQNFFQNYANQFNSQNQNYWNTLNQSNLNNTNTFNWLQNLAAGGQSAGANLGTLGAQSASTVGNALVGAGNATASGIVGSTNALTGAGNSLVTSLLQPQTNYNNSILGSLLNSGAGAGYNSGTGGLY